MGTRSKLAEARIERDLTQAQVAEHIEVDVATVCRWEKGSSQPYPRHTKKLCDLFGKSAFALGLAPSEEAQTVPTSALPVVSRPKGDHTFATFFRRDLELRLDYLMYDWLHSKKPLDARAMLQSRLSQELEEYDSMTTNEPKQRHEDVDIGRRDALRRLALLPIYALGLDVLGQTPTWAPEDLLTHCAAGVTACEHLSKGIYEEMTLASSVLSTYLAPLKEIVAESSVHRKEAARLVAQALLIKATLSSHTEGTKRALQYARQAAIYSEESGDLPLRLVVLGRLAVLYSWDKQIDKALETALQTQYLLEQAALPVPSLIQSAIYSRVAKFQAQNRRADEGDAALHQAHETFPSSSATESALFAEFNQSNLLYDDGMTHYYRGAYDKAFTIFAQAIDPETLMPRIPTSSERKRVEILNRQALTLLKCPQKDLELSVKLWTAGIKGAVALRSEQRFQEALTAYDIMEALWAGDKRIKELRDVTRHW